MDDTYALDRSLQRYLRARLCRIVSVSRLVVDDRLSLGLGMGVPIVCLSQLRPE